MSSLKNFGVSFMITIFSYLLGPLSLILVVKPLSVSDYGMYSLISTFVSFFLMFCGLGINRFNYKEIPSKEEETQYSIFKTTLIVELMFSIILSIVLFFMFKDKMQIRFLVLLFFYLFFSLINVEFLRFLGLQKKISLKSLLSFFEEKFWMLPILLVIIFSSVTLEKIFVAKMITSFIVLLLCFKNINFKLFIKSKFEISIISKFLKFSIPLILVDIGIYLLEAGDRYILGIYKGTNEVGLYSFAYSWIRIIFTLSTVFMFVMQPYVSDFYGREKDKFVELITLIKKYTILILFSGLIYFMINFKDLILLLGKSDYLYIWNTLLILMFFPIFMTPAYFFQMILILEGKNFKVSNSYVIAVMVNIVSNFILIPFLGKNGAAVSTVLAYLVLSVMNYRCMDCDIKSSLSISKDEYKIIFFLLIFTIVNVVFVKINIVLRSFILLIFYILVGIKTKIIKYEEIKLLKEM